MDDNYKPLITVSGPPASGTSSVSKRLASQLQFELVNGGRIFREMATERNLTLGELSTLSEEDDTIDKQLDSRLKNIINEHVTGEREPTGGNGLIVESRLAAWHANGFADVTVYLDAPLSVREARVTDRGETLEELREREQSEAQRYEDYYDIDVTDMSVYDMVIDTEAYTVTEIADAIIDELEETLSEE